MSQLTTSEEETSVDQESDNERPLPSIDESSVPSTGQESQENIDEKLRNREAAVEHVLGPDHEKLENFSTWDALEVRVDLEISELLTNEDLEKENSPGAVHHSDDESKQDAAEHVLKPSNEEEENSSSSDTLEARVVDAEISELLTNEDLRKENSPGAAHQSDDEPRNQEDQVKQTDALLSSMEEGQVQYVPEDKDDVPEDKGDVPEDIISVPEDEGSVPRPPELELQRNLHAAAVPGAFSVVPQEEHRFREIMFQRSQNTGVESSVSATPRGGVAESQAANGETLVSAPPRGGVAESQAASGETLVYATLVPSVPGEAASTILPSSNTNGNQSGAFASSSSPEAFVAHAEGMSCWTFIKRNRKAQYGITIAIFFFCLLIAAMVFAFTWEIADDDDKLLTLPPQSVVVDSSEDTISAVPTISPLPN